MKELQRRIDESERIWQKAKQTSSGYVVKRHARIEHECSECGSLIEIGEEYYQVSNRSDGFGYPDYFSKAICENCWNGRPLKA